MAGSRVAHTANLRMAHIRTVARFEFEERFSVIHITRIERTSGKKNE